MIKPTDTDAVIYVAGPCSGLPFYNAPAFADMADRLHHWFPTATIINPTASGIPPEDPWVIHLRWCIQQVGRSTVLVQLDDWHKSRGATLEAMLADMLDIPRCVLVGGWNEDPRERLFPAPPITLAQLAEMPEPARHYFQTRMVSAPEHKQAEGTSFREWVAATMMADIDRTVPKATAYGARGEDMIAIGRNLARMTNLGVDDRKAAALGCHFYLLGKVARGDEAIRNGLKPSTDTLFDISIYLVMMMRILETGYWGSNEKSPLDAWWIDLDVSVALAQAEHIRTFDAAWYATTNLIQSVQNQYERGYTPSYAMALAGYNFSLLARHLRDAS